MVRGLMLVLVVLALARPAAAQDRLTVFLHGFNSNASTWADTASRLEARLQMTKALPELPWHLPFDAQANHLNSLAGGIGAPANMLMVGHSNGGLVARQLSTKRGMGGIVTLGSPHRGAPLARNIQGVTNHYLFTGEKLSLLLYMVGATSNNRFTGIWNSPGVAWIRSAISGLGAALWWTIGSISNSIGPVVTAPVLGDMTPGSAALNSLNAAGNLARESVTVPGRVGLVFVARDWWIGAPFVAGAPHLQYSGDQAIRYGIQALSAIAGYFGPPNFLPTDPYANSIRMQAQSIISDLLVYNSRWCAATTDRADCSISTDGVVPTDSQFFPGDAINMGYFGPAHITEKQVSEDHIFDALHRHLRLPLRGTSSGGGGGGGGGSAPAASTLSPAERLYPDTEIRSPNGAYALRYQSDGNLVLYGPDGVVWDSKTDGMGGHYCEMQPDGNFVIYHANGGEPWASDTNGLLGAELRVLDEGYVAIYDTGGNVAWWVPR
jgi:pimeloyl-ACP methyl ester carboxylesterase